MGLVGRYLGVVEVGEGLIGNCEEVGLGSGVGRVEEVGKGAGGVDGAGHLGGGWRRAGWRGWCTGGMARDNVR